MGGGDRKRLRLDYIGASMAGDNRHALAIMQELGVRWSSATPQPIADCWIFDDCTDVPSKLPSYVEETTP